MIGRLQTSLVKRQLYSEFIIHFFSSGFLKAKQYMDEENYDKIISECTKEIESGGRYTAEALLLRATFYLLIGNATAAQPDLDQVINMQESNVKVETFSVFTRNTYLLLLVYVGKTKCWNKWPT
ncbi:Mitochondrial import receptor subunit TOM70 [Ameca splendens]|uniref:Mitochondrial import receptor subunit TOM70 n=1 Tax=Ameca splendens TaxID=208324 RepID=A0ABV0Y5J2_9TELE